MRLALLLWLGACAVKAPRPVPHLMTDGPVVVAHRGWSSRAPENTHAAFGRASEAGIAFELDVGLAADGSPWVLHDDTLDRTTTGTGPLDQAWPAALLGLDAGAWFDPPHPGERLPRLEDVLGVHSSAAWVDVEIKAPRPNGPWTAADLGRVVARTVVDGGWSDRVVITSFDPAVLASVRKEAPELRRGWLFGAGEVDADTRREQILDALRRDRQVHPDVVAPKHVLLDAAFVRALAERGLPILTWTVNDADRARQLAAWGVAGIVTDDPAAIGEAVSR